MFHIVLVEPEIPQNTGNIARTCAATGSVLHLVKPLGFSVDDKHLKRAGLDYWRLLDIRYYENLAHFFAENPDGPYYYLSIKAPPRLYGSRICGWKLPDVWQRNSGLPEGLLAQHPERCLRIPMREGARSLEPVQLGRL